MIKIKPKMSFDASGSCPGMKGNVKATFPSGTIIVIAYVRKMNYTSLVMQGYITYQVQYVGTTELQDEND